MSTKSLYTVGEAATLIAKVTGEHCMHVAEFIVAKIKPSISYSSHGHRQEVLKIRPYDVYQKKMEDWPSYPLYRYSQTKPDEPYHFFTCAPYRLCLFDLVELLDALEFHPDRKQQILESLNPSPPIPKASKQSQIKVIHGPAQTAQEDTNPNPKNQRRDLLTIAIESAQKSCTNPSDAPAIWSSLIQMANAQKPPLVGFSEDGIKWQNANDEIKFFSLKNLRDRVARQQKKLKNSAKTR